MIYFKFYISFTLCFRKACHLVLMNSCTVGRSAAQGGILVLWSRWLLCSAWHTYTYSVTHMILQCGGIGDWRKWLKFTLHWQREPQDPGPQDLLHTNLNPGTYGHKISSQKTLSQKNPISTAGAGQKPEVKTRLRSKASISSLFTTIKVLRLWI